MGSGCDTALEGWVSGAPSLHPCGTPSTWSTHNPPCKQGRTGNGGAGCHSHGSGRVVVVPVPVLYT